MKKELKFYEMTKQQRLFFMPEINFEENTFYPFYYEGEVLCLPYNYKEYAKELLEDAPSWKNRVQQIAIHNYSLDLCRNQERKHKQKLESEQSLDFKPDLDFKSYYQKAVEEQLPEFVMEKEIEERIIRKAKQQHLPTYHIEELLQLNNQSQILTSYQGSQGSEQQNLNKPTGALTSCHNEMELD